MLVILPGSDCSDTDYIQVLIYPGFEAAISFDNTCAQTEVAFTDLSTTVYGNLTNWSWNYGDGGRVQFKTHFMLTMARRLYDHF
ncbi:MAG: hypothetical protein IPI65_17505 [Bacteroidetes bacterium]|nr:hypothetical protein [Bacteroidota bacterium]